jgi:MoaA/NifB/PqqE/SkfB family radical SAM enzyme
MNVLHGVIFYFTQHCNAKCDFCITNSSPETKTTLPLEVIKRCLREAGEIGIRKVGLTGGEPAINRHRLFEIMEAGRELGLTFYMSSNAFWAKTYDKAVEMVKELKSRGLVQLNLSADRFHIPYVSNQCNVNAARACEEVGDIFVHIQVAATRLDADGTADKIVKDFEGLKADVKVYYPQPMGRGESLPKEVFFTDQLDKVLSRRCDQADIPVVHPDGQVLTCCSIPSAYTYPQFNSGNCRYVYGNVLEESLADILLRADGDPLIKLLIDEGPGALVKRYGREFEAEGYRLGPRYYSHCHLCTEVLDNPKLVQIVNSRLNHLR